MHCTLDLQVLAGVFLRHVSIVADNETNVNKQYPKIVLQVCCNFGNYQRLLVDIGAGLCYYKQVRQTSKTGGKPVSAMVKNGDGRSSMKIVPLVDVFVRFS